MLWFVFERGRREKPRLWPLAGYGVGWSFLLDLPAILAAFAVPGGLWIC